MRIARKPLLVAATLAGALSLAACSGGAAPSEGGGSGAGFPVTVAHAYGETTVDAAPERVATVAWGNQDVALALGVVPVGMAAVTYGDDDANGILPWVEDALDELGGETPALFDEVDGINFEQVSDTAPDVILGATSGLTEEEYNTLSEIAPTVSYPGVAWLTTWQDSTLLDGAALGLEGEAEALVAKTEATVAAAAEANPELAGKKVAYISLDPSDLSTIYVYLPEDVRPTFLRELGMVDSAGVTRLQEENEGAFYATLTAETLDVLADADIIVNYGGADTLAAMQADPLIGALPAVKNGAVAIVGDGTPLAAAFSTPTVLSIPWGLDDYTALLAAAAAKVQ